MMGDTPTTVLYKDVISDLNTTFRELIQYYSMADYKSGYLKTFEHVLSLALPNKTLHERGDYKELAEQFPLPSDPNTEISPDAFDSYMWLYEKIMRDVKLVDKEPDKGESKTIEAFDLGGF